MRDDPAAADHLADIDARYEAHLAALRELASGARVQVADDGETLPSPEGGVPLWDDLAST